MQKVGFVPAVSKLVGNIRTPSIVWGVYVLLVLIVWLCSSSHSFSVMEMYADVENSCTGHCLIISSTSVYAPILEF
jgi:hypothetical protein